MHVIIFSLNRNGRLVERIDFAFLLRRILIMAANMVYDLNKLSCYFLD